MRRILVDFARAKRYQKRGGGAMQVTLVDDVALVREPGRDLVALDDALEALAKVDERKSRVIEMRFFGGLSVEEDRRSAARVARDGHARLEAGEGLAAPAPRRDLRRARRMALRSMTPMTQRWRELERLYHAALDAPAEERSAFLAEACASDETLRREVLSRCWTSRRCRSFSAGRPSTSPPRW